MSVLGLGVGQKATAQRPRKTINKIPNRGGNKIHAISSSNDCVKFIPTPYNNGIIYAIALIPSCEKSTPTH